MSEKSDLELIEAVFDGEKACFGELCSRYYAAMVAIAHSIVKDRHLAEDAAQETFARACFRLSGLRDKMKFGVWLAAICRNASLDILRTQCHFSDSEQVEPAVIENTQVDEEQNVLKKVLHELPPKLREVIYLKYYDGLTYQKISSVLGISEQAINGRLRRAKKVITRELKRKGLTGWNYER